MVLSTTNQQVAEPPNCCSRSNSIGDIKITTHPGGIVEEKQTSHAEDVRHDEPAPASSATTTKTTTAMMESLQAQIQAIATITAMEDLKYQRHLMENTLVQIDDPSLLKLHQLIHRLHSLVTNLTEENDSQTEEIVMLQSKLESSQQHNEKLEQAVSKLHSQNLKLKKKNKADKAANRKLIEEVKRLRAVERQMEEDEQVGKLLQHEQVLRERTDSNFSDLDGLQEFDGRSVDSVTSSRSLVANNGPPTVRIHRERCLTWPPTDFSSGLDEDPLPFSSEEKKAMNEDESSCAITLEESVAGDEEVSQCSKRSNSTFMKILSFHQHEHAAKHEKMPPQDAETGTAPAARGGDEETPTDSSAMKPTKEDSTKLNSVMSMFYKNPTSNSAKEGSNVETDDNHADDVPTLKAKFELWKKKDKSLDASDDTKDASTEAVVAVKGEDTETATDSSASLPTKDDSTKKSSVMSMFYKMPTSHSAKEVSSVENDDKHGHEVPTMKTKFELWKRKDKTVDGSDAMDDSQGPTTSAAAGMVRKGLLDLSDDADIVSSSSPPQPSFDNGMNASGDGPTTKGEPAKASAFTSSMKNMGKLFTLH
eukprot:scaffold10490_cov129-Cylindrotheca_fusiformis.AAC.5